MNSDLLGFIIWTFTYIGTGCFLVWIFTPSHILHDFGITYYPNHWWALALPSFLVLLLLFILFGYDAYNKMKTEPATAFSTITDSFARDPPSKSLGQRQVLPPISDVPLTSVNEALHIKRRR